MLAEAKKHLLWQQHYMENLRVIQVEVIAPEKPLDANTSSKKNFMLISLFAIISNYLCVDMASYDIQKYFMLI